MARKVIHEIKVPMSVTVALYMIGAALFLNLAKPLVSASPAFADLSYGDRIEVEIANWPYSIEVTGELRTCEMC